MDLVSEKITESIETKKKMMSDGIIRGQIYEAAQWIRDAIEKGGKVLFCGNGGSASDSLHLAGEMVGRFQKERKSLPAVSLNADVAVLTAIANDYGYDFVFSRALEGIGRKGDVLVGISTSGNSNNICEAVKKAKTMGIRTVCFLGRNGGKLKDMADIPMIVPSDCTARIQEAHIMMGHIICELVENAFS